MKQKIINELDEIILKKLERDSKNEYCIEVIEDRELNMEDSEVTQFIAGKKDNIIFYKHKFFFHTMREFQPREQQVRYSDININKFSEEELLEILRKVKSF